MGLFDTVWMICPHCHQRTSEQTKAGQCDMQNLTLNDDFGIAWDLSRSGDLQCQACGKNFRVVETRFATVRSDLAPPEIDYDEDPYDPVTIEKGKYYP